MRIVAGRWRGRRLAAPRGRVTRPTSDRAREAVFSSLVSRLGSDLGGGEVLDLFAGSGALGLEALSRGAAGATFVERDGRALDALGRNADELGAGPAARVVRADAKDAVRRPLPGAPFSLLFLDPPYRIDPAEVAEVLDALARGGCIVPGAHVVWEHASETGPDWPRGFEPLATRRYGGTSVDLAVYAERTGTES